MSSLFIFSCSCFSLRRTFAPLFNMKRTKKKVQPSSNNDIEDVVPELSWQPPDWFTTLENIQLMRVKNDAPVDTMGCHALADKNTDPKVRFPFTFSEATSVSSNFFPVFSPSLLICFN